MAEWEALLDVVAELHAASPACSASVGQIALACAIAESVPRPPASAGPASSRTRWPRSALFADSGRPPSAIAPPGVYGWRE